MRTVVGGTRRAAPPQIQLRPDLRHYFVTNQWESIVGGATRAAPAPGAAPPRSAAGCTWNSANLLLKR